MAWWRWTPLASPCLGSTLFALSLRILKLFLYSLFSHLRGVPFLSPLTGSDIKQSGTWVLQLHLSFLLKIAHRLLQITLALWKEGKSCWLDYILVQSKVLRCRVLIVMFSELQLWLVNHRSWLLTWALTWAPLGGLKNCFRVRSCPGGVHLWRQKICKKKQPKNNLQSNTLIRQIK